MSQKNTIFNVRCDQFSPKRLHEILVEYLKAPRMRTIFTPNPENLLFAHADSSVRYAYNQADLSLPDGIGISLMHFLRTGRRLRRFSGIDTAELLLTFAAEKKMRVALLGGRDGAGEKSCAKLQEHWPSLTFRAVGDNVPFDMTGRATLQAEAAIAKELTIFQPHILFVGLGAPKQEYWIVHHGDAFSSVHIMMGLGGAFDMWSGRIPRAPTLIRTVGFEWLWRFSREPRRAPRMINALIIFPWIFLREKPRP